MIESEGLAIEPEVLPPGPGVDEPFEGVLIPCGPAEEGVPIPPPDDDDCRGVECMPPEISNKEVEEPCLDREGEADAREGTDGIDVRYLFVVWYVV